MAAILMLWVGASLYRMAAILMLWVGASLYFIKLCKCA